MSGAPTSDQIGANVLIGILVDHPIADLLEPPASFDPRNLFDGHFAYHQFSILRRSCRDSAYKQLPCHVPLLLALFLIVGTLKGQALLPRPVIHVRFIM